MDTLPSLTPLDDKPGGHLRAYALTLAACLATTLLATPLLDVLDLANIVMLFLLTVLLIAVYLGRRPAVLGSVLSVLLFDVFFVPPRFSLAVNNLQYLVTFAVMLATALITTHFTSHLRQQAEEARIRARRTQALYQLARQLAGSLDLAQASAHTRRFISDELQAGAVLLLPDARESRLAAFASDNAPPWEPHLALVAWHSGQTVRSDEVSGLGFASLYLPLQGSTRLRGVLAIRFEAHPALMSPETGTLLETLASLLAVAMERLHYVEVAQATEMHIQSERLRSSILSALSHDLRTPLTAMVGLADSLFLIKPPLPAAGLDTAQALHEQATRLAGLVANLLDMARLNAGQVSLRREWQPLEEVVGASLKLLAPALAGHPLKVQVPHSLPLLEFDAVLIERVLCNLLENAAKYAPAGSDIELSAVEEAGVVRVSVRDHGPGLPENVDRDALFQMFVRGERESGKPGTGLGLAICKTIVEAHGGRIAGENLASGGTRIHFTLPKGNPPTVEEEAA